MTEDFITESINKWNSRVKVPKEKYNQNKLKIDQRFKGYKLYFQKSVNNVGKDWLYLYYKKRGYERIYFIFLTLLILVLISILIYFFVLKIFL